MVKEGEPHESFHFSNDDELWKENFTCLRPKNFMKRNVRKVLNNPDANRTDDGSTSYYHDTAFQFKKVFQNAKTNKHLNPVSVAKKKLDAERLKIKNIIANNPFLVKNYVTLEGDDVNNSLIPKKLLYEKLVKLDNDDEFVEDYVKRM